MTLLEHMKADAAECNEALYRSTGSSQRRKSLPTRKGKSPAVARRHEEIRSLMGHMTVKEMACRLYVSTWTINSDLRTIMAEDSNAES